MFVCGCACSRDRRCRHNGGGEQPAGDTCAWRHISLRAGSGSHRLPALQRHRHHKHHVHRGQLHLGNLSHRLHYWVSIVCVYLWSVGSISCVSISGLWGQYRVCLSLVCGVNIVCVYLWSVGSISCVSSSGLWGHYRVCLVLVYGVSIVCVYLWSVGSVLCVSSTTPGLWGQYCVCLPYPLVCGVSIVCVCLIPWLVGSVSCVTDSFSDLFGQDCECWLPGCLSQPIVCISARFVSR